MANENNNIQNNKANIPAPPPMVKKGEKAEKPESSAPKAPTPKEEKPSKSPKGNSKKLLAILIPVIAVIVVGAIILAVVLTKNKKDGKNTLGTLSPVVVTDANGVPVTDVNGEVITVMPETEIVKVTDKNGYEHTSVVYKDVVVKIPVTDENGKFVYDDKGDVVTEEYVYNPSVTEPGAVIGTTVVPVTDGEGNTAVNDKGEVITTVVDVTSNPNPAEPAKIDWKAGLGGTAKDYISSVAAMSDGGYITATVTNSTDGDFAKYKELNYAKPYTVLTKYSKNGDVVWEKAVGSKKGITRIEDIVVTKGDDFYAVGYGKNIGGVTGKGYYDGAVLKFNKKGEQIWSKTFGTSTVDMFYGADLADNGDIIVVGSVGNNDGDAKGFNKPELKSAASVVRYNSDGDVVWKNILGGDGDIFNNVAVGSDGNIYIVGNFVSGTFFKGLGKNDSGVVKLNSKGELVSVQAIAGKGTEEFKGITACKNGGVTVVGRSDSSDSGNTDSFFTGNLASRGGYDAYIIKFDENLNIKFATSFRGQYNDELVDVVEKDDGSFIAVGSSNSSSRDLKGITTRGGNDIVLASFDSLGMLSWARSFGGSNDEKSYAVALSKDGGYVVAGETGSSDVDMEGIAQYVTGNTKGVIVKFPE
ncbi:MAG: hypothetical protein ACI4IF_00080 [Acutalibacteraceae bacterium]